jgi:hypothetical protein
VDWRDEPSEVIIAYAESALPRVLGEPRCASIQMLQIVDLSRKVPCPSKAILRAPDKASKSRVSLLSWFFFVFLVLMPLPVPLNRNYF